MPKKKTSVNKKNNNKLNTKELVLVGLLESLIFSIFVSFGNTYMFYQLFGTKYDVRVLTVFLIQLPISFVIFGCFILVYIIYINSKIGNK